MQVKSQFMLICWFSQLTVAQCVPLQFSVKLSTYCHFWSLHIRHMTRNAKSPMSLHKHHFLIICKQSNYKIKLYRSWWRFFESFKAYRMQMATHVAFYIWQCTFHDYLNKWLWLTCADMVDFALLVNIVHVTSLIS